MVESFAGPHIFIHSLKSMDSVRGFSKGVHASVPDDTGEDDPEGGVLVLDSTKQHGQSNAQASTV